MKPWVGGLAAAALFHVTPTVVLVKGSEAVQRVLPNAEAFVARQVHLSRADRQHLKEAARWAPEDDVLTFYTGTRGGDTIGALLFMRVEDAAHGPVEVAVGFAPEGRVLAVVVTKATVETKAWVLEALRAGLTNHYKGLKPGDTPAASKALKDHVGSLAQYIAREVDEGVARALTARGMFYKD